MLEAIKEALHKMQWATILTETLERIVGSFETSFVKVSYVLKGVKCVYGINKKINTYIFKNNKW